MLLRHALRSFLFGALTGYREALLFDDELLYVAALFHNVGLNARYCRSPRRFEIDSADEARDFLRSNGIGEPAVTEVWTAIALHTTPGIPEYMSPLVFLVSAGVQMDLRGARYDEFTPRQRDEVVRAFPRESEFKHEILEVYARGMERRPETAFGSINADILDRCDPNYRRINFCGLVLGSRWST
ncbi:HD domain-containing protein [Trinickia caryophylli]|uniref:HD domain-containing protein n=2 Tax=Trinickia caryophylli TaxID=28094 RepID=A0A1X7CY55_TRICW|nr:HD domain-containing protein [Trinickia caryophylli]